MKQLMQRYGKWLNKRVLTAAGLCLLLAAAIVTNVLVNKSKATTEKTGTQNAPEVTQVSTQNGTQMNFFAAYRDERDSVRTQELAYLDAIVAQGADTETLSDAQQQKLELVNAMETELTVENLVRAKGFSDVIVSISDTSASVLA